MLATTAAMLLFIAALTLVQVFYRYVLNNALSWSAELTRIVFIWMTFIASGVAINRRRHLRIDTFVNLVPHRLQLVIDLLVHFVAVAFFAFLALRAFDLAQRAANTVTGALRWPRTVFFLPVGIGGALIVLFSFRVIGEDIVRLRDAFSRRVRGS